MYSLYYPGYGFYEQAGLHYVNVDTVKTGGGDQLTLRALDNKQGPSGNAELPREVITEEIRSMGLRLPSYGYGYPGDPAILTSRSTHEGQRYMVSPRRDIFCIRAMDWKSLPQRLEDCKASLLFFDPLSSSIISVYTLAIEFDSSWIVDLPETLEELKAENSARGLVATWIEGAASGWVKTPRFYLIDKGTLLVLKTRGYGPVCHDCDGKYSDMPEPCCNDAIYAFIKALDEFVPYEEYGDLHEKNNPDCWDEDLHMWFDFNIFHEIGVLVRFEYADREEVCR
ncbi:hypothetical protein FGADI_12404 [Fusarium gaditjirri]|uniref:Uncharacterized protein n=1 Tax=Fusarium gaditjirri TaxID=282569 RepID=A0A8H4WP82_9HYPO|nr:hypothetical protein FGADI_12404 [Fusarium gaditjirri]